MIFNINDLLVSISDALDFIEKDIIEYESNHGKTVAYISARIGKELKLPKEDLFDLISYALLHDNGMSNLLLHNTNSLVAMEKNKIHCVYGEDNIQNFPFINRINDVILYHHERYDGKGPFEIVGSEIPFYSRIIALADFVAIKYAAKESITNICNEIAFEIYNAFDPDVVQVFLRIQENVEFWLEMDRLYLDGALSKLIPQIDIQMDYKRIRDASKVFSKLIDAKSPFTGNHSKGISERVGILCEYYGYDEEVYWKMRIAADLHDIGKLVIDNSILDKPGKLSEEEFHIIQSHTFHTRKILSKIKGFEDITEWASNHHEKINGSGYPYGYKGDRLDRNSRIMACVDIYQALIEERPYRDALSHEQAIKIMKEMTNKEFIDDGIVKDIDNLFRKD